MSAYEYRFTCENFKKVGYALLVFAYIGLMFMLVVGTSFTNLRQFDNPMGSSFLLFPGRDLLVCDIMYILTLCICCILLFYFFAVQDWFEKNKSKSIYGIPLCILTCHFGGNFHYFFYSSVDVIHIPNKVTFGTMFDIRTFVVGPAGILLLTSPFWIMYSIFFGGRKFMFKKVPVENNLESGEQETQ